MIEENLRDDLNKYNSNGNLMPPNRIDMENLAEEINLFYSGTNKTVQVGARHIDLAKTEAHFVTNVYSRVHGRCSSNFIKI